VRVSNIELPKRVRALISEAEEREFTNVKSTTGAKPDYVTINNTNIIY
jgi:hypothetical protein